FGRSFTFGKGLETPSDGHTLTYRDALSLILGNLFTAVFTATINLPSWMLPGRFRNVQDAVDNFRQYMVEMVDDERAAIAAGGPERDNLMSILVRASEASKMEGKGTRHLTDSEIFGNLFSYNLAGHETTSNTLAYAMILLAANPQWQEWAAEEVEDVTGGISIEDVRYETAYPQLKRCLAIMVRTLTHAHVTHFRPIGFADSPIIQARDASTIRSRTSGPQSDDHATDPNRQRQSLRHPRKHLHSREPRRPAHLLRLVGRRPPRMAPQPLDHQG
ncbi:cytochrome P450, partial [Candidatus Bathyarchaeota archaeon]|nr:cytochrome P450 [Candidatus Bathyarchaeota archaeon]